MDVDVGKAKQTQYFIFFGYTEKVAPSIRSIPPVQLSEFTLNIWMPSSQSGHALQTTMIGSARFGLSSKEIQRLPLRIAERTSIPPSLLIFCQVKELSETLAGMKGNLKRLEVMTRAWAAQPLFERGAKTSTAENFQQMQSVIVTQRQATQIGFGLS